MFLTSNALVIQYGVDETIAKFYVDREPPKNNLYWKDKQLYLRPQPGYIFLPLITDLYYRSGISKEVLLSEDLVQVLEQIGHYSAEQEFGLIDKEEAVEKCAALVQQLTTKKQFLNSLIDYFNSETNFISELTTPFPALHRGDYFLFALCLLDIGKEKQTELIKTWFALISTLLLMDDAEDFYEDQKNNDENAFVQSGADKDGFDRIKKQLSLNLNHLKNLNSTMANALHNSFKIIGEKPFIKQYLNA